MKKTIAIAFAMLAAASVHAVTLTFAGNTSTTVIYGLTDTHTLTVGAGSETASLAVYYILASNLGELDGTGLLGEGLIGKDDFLDLGIDKAISKGQTSTSTTASGRFATANGIPGSVAGDQYFVRIYATFGGQEYFMDLKDQGTGAFWITTKTGNDTISEALGWTAPAAGDIYGGDTGKLGDWNKWVAVPEPATAGLALAGLALLFKRRRK